MGPREIGPAARRTASACALVENALFLDSRYIVNSLFTDLDFVLRDTSGGSPRHKGNAAQAILPRRRAGRTDGVVAVIRRIIGECAFLSDSRFVINREMRRLPFSHRRDMIGGGRTAKPSDQWPGNTATRRCKSPQRRSAFPRPQPGRIQPIKPFSRTKWCASNFAVALRASVPADCGPK